MLPRQSTSKTIMDVRSAPLISIYTFSRASDSFLPDNLKNCQMRYLVLLCRTKTAARIIAATVALNAQMLVEGSVTFSIDVIVDTSVNVSVDVLVMVEDIVVKTTCVVATVVGFSGETLRMKVSGAYGQFVMSKKSPNSPASINSRSPDGASLLMWKVTVTLTCPLGWKMTEFGSNDASSHAGAYLTTGFTAKSHCPDKGCE